MARLDTYFTHAQACDNVRVQSATQWTASGHAQTCDNVRVKSARQWTASVHTLRMPKPVTTFVFKVLRNGLLRYIYFTHVTICDNVPVGRTFEWFWVAAKICDPAAIRCCFTAIGDSTHVFKKTHFFPKAPRKGPSKELMQYRPPT